MNNLAFLLDRAGDHEDAIRLLGKCLSGRRKVLGEDHPDTVATAEYLRKLEEQQQAAPPSA
jgi:hypothetical protein